MKRKKNEKELKKDEESNKDQSTEDAKKKEETGKDDKKESLSDSSELIEISENHVYDKSEDNSENITEDDVSRENDFQKRKKLSTASQGNPVNKGIKAKKQ